MQKNIVIMGLGEMAGVFSRGLLKSGYTITPVLRHTNPAEIAAQIPQPELVLLGVAEKDLHSSLDQLPAGWRHHLVLLQNELLPTDWQRHNLKSPTVISVWFEKKPGQDYKVLVPSPVFGPKAQAIHDALATLEIPCEVLENEDQLLYELVRKNVYILTTNIAGLITGGTVEHLWNQHRDLANAVIDDVIEIQNHLTGRNNDREALVKGMVDAIQGDLEHKCMGRSAPARLANALRIADEAGLSIPKLREISRLTDKNL